MTGRKRIRLLHTSDVHLGADWSLRGPARHGPMCLCPLQIVADAAVQSECDLLVVAGDLFDHNRVSDALVGELIHLLDGLPLRTFLVPGNHDALDSTSVYHRFARHAPSPAIRIADNPLGSWTEYPEQNLSVWGRPIVVHEPAYRPFGSPIRRPRPASEAWHVVVAHGHYVETHARDAVAPRSSPFCASELAQIDADYVALGHWDVPTRVGHEHMPSWYSGSPTDNGEPRTAILATLDTTNGVQVEHVQLHPNARQCQAG